MVCGQCIHAHFRLRLLGNFLSGYFCMHEKAHPEQQGPLSPSSMQHSLQDHELSLGSHSRSLSEQSSGDRRVHFSTLLPGETPSPVPGPEHLATPEKSNPPHPGLGPVWGVKCPFQILFFRSYLKQPFLISGNIFLSHEATVLNLLKLGHYLASIHRMNSSIEKTFTVVGAL